MKKTLFGSIKPLGAGARVALVAPAGGFAVAQLSAEFRRLFPNNAVEYFVSYYDYYQPQAVRLLGRNRCRTPSRHECRIRE